MKQTIWINETWILKFTKLAIQGHYKRTPSGLNKFIETYSLEDQSKITGQIWLSTPDILQFVKCCQDEIFTPDLKWLKMFVNVNKSTMYSQAKKTL